MRRVVAAITAVLLVSLVASVAVVTETGTYRDQFSKLGYSGSDGNLHWSTAWIEFGESDGSHAKGKV